MKALKVIKILRLLRAKRFSSYFADDRFRIISKLVCLLIVCIIIVLFFIFVIYVKKGPLVNMLLVSAGVV